MLFHQIKNATFLSTDQISGTSLHFMSQPGLGASKIVLITDHFPQILGKSYLILVLKV